MSLGPHQQQQQQHQHRHQRRRRTDNENDDSVIRVGIDFGNTIGDLWSNTSTSETVTTTMVTTTSTTVNKSDDADAGTEFETVPSTDGYYFPYAIEMIRHMVHKFGADNVFIISKAGPKLQYQITNWLNETQFWEKISPSSPSSPSPSSTSSSSSTSSTSSSSSPHDGDDNHHDDDGNKMMLTTMMTKERNLIFVREYADKAKIVQKLNINIFFDDHIKVIRCLASIPCITRIYWMNQYTNNANNDNENGNNNNDNNNYFHYKNKADDNKMYVIEKRYRNKLIIPKKNWQSIMKMLQKIPSSSHAKGKQQST